MRWLPLVSLFAVLSVTSIIEGVFAAPLDVILEGRARDKNGLTAGSLKESSYTYRKNALKGDTFTKSGGKIAKLRTPKSPPGGKDADHILEAQTVAKALKNAGYTTTGSLGAPAHRAVKDILNHHSNMAFVDADVNREKGQAHRAALSGKTPSKKSKYMIEYMKQTKDAANKTAKKIDLVLKRFRVPGVSVKDEQDGVFKKLKIKRELLLEELD